MTIGGVISDMDLADARDLRGRLGNRADALPRHQQMDLAKLRGCGDGRQRSILQHAALMLDPDQRLHAATPNALSFATSSSTSATLMPAVRLGGSATLSVLRRGLTSTP